MDNQNTTPPDMIAQAGELLRILQQSTGWISQDKDAGDDRAIVIASAVLAVAGELRELRNVLADGLLSQLAELDADNAAPTDRLRSEATR